MRRGWSGSSRRLPTLTRVTGAMAKKVVGLLVTYAESLQKLRAELLLAEGIWSYCTAIPLSNWVSALDERIDVGATSPLAPSANVRMDVPLMT
jgi:hypothetical protein